tara:strand:- start:68 stop:280 length:213 start_codon:yes stop_codon:yes gene_type:complete
MQVIEIPRINSVCEKIVKIGAMVNYNKLKPTITKGNSFKNKGLHVKRQTNVKDIYAYEYKTTYEFSFLKW